MHRAIFSYFSRVNLNGTIVLVMCNGQTVGGSCGRSKSHQLLNHMIIDHVAGIELGKIAPDIWNNL